MTQVFLFNQDITKRVQPIASVPLSIGDYGQVTIGSLPNITGISKHGFWDQQNPRSPFFGISDLSALTITIKQGEVSVYQGGIQTIQNDSGARTAQITLRSDAQIAIEHGAKYVSGTTTVEGSTPSTIVRELLIRYGLQIDSESFALAESTFSSNSVLLNVTYVTPDDTVMSILEAICAITCSRIYVVNGIFFMDVYGTIDLEPAITFTDIPATGQKITLWSHPTTENISKEPCTGYTVRWQGEPLADVGEATAGKKTIDGSADSPVSIMTLQSAVWIGEQWMDYLNRHQSRVTFQVPPWYGKTLALGQAVALDYSKWNGPITIDLTSIDNSARGVTTLTGITR